MLLSSFTTNFSLMVTLGLLSQVPIAFGAKATQIKISTNYSIGSSKAYGKIELGGFSGLALSPKESTKNTLTFYSLTDRGPNAKKLDFTGDGHPDRPFILPTYTPLLLKIVYDVKSKTAKVTDKIPLIKPNSASKISGLPNVDRARFKENYDETPVQTDGSRLQFDTWGLDPEGIAVDENGDFWVSEEYGPSILKVSKEGKIVNRWSPSVSYNATYEVRGGQQTLPKIFGKRRLNAGFEGLAISGTTLFAFLQRPIPTTPKNKFIRVLAFSTDKKKTEAVFLYPLDKESKKIGGATTLDDGSIAVLEHSGEKGKKAYQKIYVTNFKSATNVISHDESLETDAQKISKVKVASKKLLHDVTKYGVYLSEKPEGIAYFGDGKIALVNDNDFNLANIFNEKAQKEDQEENLFIILSDK